MHFAQFENRGPTCSQMPFEPVELVQIPVKLGPTVLNVLIIGSSSMNFRRLCICDQYQYHLGSDW